MLDLVKEKINEIEKLKQKIEKLEDDIKAIQLVEKHNVKFDTWYKKEGGTTFFKPLRFDNKNILGFSVNLDDKRLAYNLENDFFGLREFFSTMQISSYGEMLNAVNLHNLEILEQYK